MHRREGKQKIIFFLSIPSAGNVQSLHALQLTWKTNIVIMNVLPPPFSLSRHNMEYFFGQFGSVILTLSPPKSSPPPGLQLKGQRKGSGEVGMGWEWGILERPLWCCATTAQQHPKHELPHSKTDAMNFPDPLAASAICI